MTETFSPVETIIGNPACGLLLLCDHASNGLPPAYGDLGLPPGELSRHIGWDIGAADVTRALAKRFDAPAVMTRFSRLLIDPNRGADDPTLVMRISDGAIVPGNAYVDEAEIERRIGLYWRPYHDAISRGIDAILATGTVPIIFSVHSFTPSWRGTPRPWQVAFLSDKDRRVTERLIAHFRADPALTVGDNEPYDGSLEGDTLYAHATARGLPHVLVEVRQDLIATTQGAEAWAHRLGDSLEPLIADAALRRIEMHGSRSGPVKAANRR